MSPTARERLRAYLVQHPSATAAQAGRALGVSRQRIHAIAQDEGLELARVSSPPAAPHLGSELAPPRLTGQASTGPATDPLRAAVFRVAADLSGRGFEVYLPADGDATHPLV